MNTYTAVTITNGPNTYNSALAVDGKLVNYSDGAQVAFVTAIASGKQDIQPGNTYVWSLPDTEVGLSTVIACYDASGVFIGNNSAISTYAVCPGVTVTPLTAKGRKCMVITIAANSPARKIQTQMINGYAAHNTADFNRIIAGCTLVTGTSPAALTFNPNINGPVKVIKSGSVYYIRTPWGATTDFIQVIQTGGSPSLTRFDSWYTVAKATTDTTVATGVATQVMNPGYVGDDVCPQNFNGTYIAGNHGPSFGVNATATGHNKTSVDIGSKWNDGVTNWTLLKIVDANTLQFISDNTGVGDAWAFTTNITGGTLNHVSGATHTTAITVSGTATSQQIQPAIQNRSYAILLDGVSTLSQTNSDGVYTCRSVSFVESYDIINLPSLITYLNANPGVSTWVNVGVASCATVATTYRFDVNGACTVSVRLTALKRLAIGYLGIIQAGKLTPPAGGTIWQYVNKVSPFAISGRTYDFQSTRDITTILDSIYLDSTRWTSNINPPDRFVQYRKATDGSRDFGIAIGYNLRLGQTTSAIRSLTAIGQALFLYTSGKQYPAVIHSAGVPALFAGDVIDVCAYRVPVNYYLNPDATCVAWHYTDDNDVYLMLDYNQAKNGYVTLDSSLLGRGIEVIESNGMTINSTDITAQGINITVTGNYGSAYLRLYPQILTGINGNGTLGNGTSVVNATQGNLTVTDSTHARITSGGINYNFNPSASNVVASPSAILSNTSNLGTNGALDPDNVLNTAGGSFDLAAALAAARADQAVNDTVPGPSGLTAKFNRDTILLSWEKRSDSIKYQYKINDGTPIDVHISNVPIRLAYGTTYNISVRIVWDNIISNWSTIQCAIPITNDDIPPVAPSDLSVAISGTSITLSWSHNDIDTVQYQVIENYNDTPIYSGLAKSYTLTMENGRRSMYRVKAVDANGNSSSYSNALCVISVNGQLTSWSLG